MTMEAAADASGSSSIVVLLAGLVLAAISYALFGNLHHRRRRFINPLPPCPRGVPLLGNLPFLQPELHAYFAALAAKHGPIFRLRLGGKTGVVISSRDLAREVLRDQDVKFANRDVPVAGRVITYGVLDIAFAAYGAEWRMRRRVCTQELFTGHTLDAVYGMRRQRVRAMVARLADKAAAGEAVCIGKEMFVLGIGVMAGMLWGGSGVDLVGHDFIGLIRELSSLVGLPNVSDFYPWLGRFDLQGIETRMLNVRERMDHVFERIIAAKEDNRQRCGGGSGSAEDFLDVMLRMVGEGAGSKVSFTKTHIKALLMDLVTGGTDSSSSTMEFVLAEMMNRPETVRAAQAELDEAVGRGRVLEESDALKLPYLSAAIKEGLRLHPALPLLIPHCPGEDCVVGGYMVPAGSRVFINAWAIHRDPEAWEEPLAYKPERFLDAASGGRDFSGNDLSYVPLGSGRRICAGMALAERTLVYALATLLHSFDWQLPDDETGVDLEEKFGIVLKKKKPLLLIPKPRLPNADLYRE